MFLKLVPPRALLLKYGPPWIAQQTPHLPSISLHPKILLMTPINFLNLLRRKTSKSNGETFHWTPCPMSCHCSSTSPWSTTLVHIMMAQPLNHSTVVVTPRIFLYPDLAPMSTGTWTCVACSPTQSLATLVSLGLCLVRFMRHTSLQFLDRHRHLYLHSHSQ
jgi:hypothetical protein